MSFQFSCPHTSPQNGKPERKIRTINNIVPTLLAHAFIPLSFRHHALQMAAYLHNIIPSKKLALHSPTKILYQKDSSYSNLRVFGCLCYPPIHSTSRNKLQPQSPHVYSWVIHPIIEDICVMSCPIVKYLFLCMPYFKKICFPFLD